MLHGGHDVPIDDIIRRYERSMENLPAALAFSDESFIYDNSESAHILHLSLENGLIKAIYNSLYPAWLKQRVVENTLQINQKLIFKNNQELLPSSSINASINAENGLLDLVEEE